MRVISCRIAFFAAVAMQFCVAAAKPVTNADVVRLIKAGVGDSTIVHVIQVGPSALDTTPDGLISLKAEGATQVILDAAVASNDHSSTVVSPTPRETGPALTNGFTSMNDVYLVDGAKRTQLLRASGRTFIKTGISRNVSWLVFSGSKAELRAATNSPTFEVSLPASLKPPDIVFIQQPDIDGDSRRVEEAVAGLFVNAHTLDKRNIALNIEEIGSGTSSRMKQYRVRPASSIAPGEYLLVALGSYYDFGIDPVP